MSGMASWVASILQRFFNRFDRLFGRVPKASGTEILCDSCKYNYSNACMRPERPNATQCPDYKRR